MTAVQTHHQFNFYLNLSRTVADTPWWLSVGPVLGKDAMEESEVLMPVNGEDLGREDECYGEDYLKSNNNWSWIFNVSGFSNSTEVSIATYKINSKLIPKFVGDDRRGRKGSESNRFLNHRRISFLF